LDSGLITFADQEPMAIRMLDAHPDYLENLGLQHIVVDEFQDSNEIQMEMVKRLAHTSCFNEMVVVGDDFQAIYAFRNTSPDNMIKFPEKMGLPVSDVYLVENYRSTPEILALADAEIKNNKNQLPKDLVAKKASIGKNPIVKGFYSPDDEVEYTVNLIKQKLSTGNYQPEDFCIITMTNQELVKYQAALAKENIPTVAKNPLKYLENSRVRAALHLAQAFWEPEVTEHYWSYLCARYNGEILNEKSDDEILAEIQDLKNDFLGMENREVSYQRTLFHEYLDALTGNDEIYASFLEMLYACEDLPSELEYAQDFKKYGKDAAKRMEQAYQGVVLTTAHSSKGLEWKVVINSITNYDNSFLHGNGNRKVKELEERRRLLYVSMTRAKDELYVTSQFIAYGSEKEGYTFNQFVEELYAITGEQYIPLDPDADKKKEAAKKAAAARNKAARERKKISEAKKKAYLDAMASAN
jgi:superfamily I DNA/RNA helicase